MVIDTGFFPALHYRVSQWGSHWSQHDGGYRRPLVELYVQKARGILHVQLFPQETTTCGPPWSNGHQGEPPDPATGKKENPPIQGRHSWVTWSNPLPPLMGLHRQTWLIPQPIPTSPSHIVLLRGPPALFLSHCWPTLSTCWMMYYTSKRKWMTQWSIYSLPGLQ